MIAKLMASLMLAASVAGAQDAEARKILDAFQSARPAVKELGWYQLDWSANLKEAREKASKERRPICLLVCINVFGNMITGHC